MSLRKDRKSALEEKGADAERYLQELVLKESALRRKERDHGTLDKRMRELEARAEELERFDRETEGQMEALKKREEEFEAKQRRHMEQYEELLRPLMDKEHALLERERTLQLRHDEEVRGFQAEMASIAETNEKAKQNEERTRALQQHALESKSRSLRTEQEVEKIREELTEELKQQKKRTEEIESRGRELEWRERESEQEQKRLAKRDHELRREMDAVDIAREELNQRETAACLKEAKLAEQKLQLKERTKRVCTADEEISARAAALDERERILVQKQREASEREASARTLGEEMQRADAALREELEELQKREAAVSRQEQQTAQRLAALNESEKELLEWMRETAWREQAVARSEELLARVGVCATGMASTGGSTNTTLPAQDMPSGKVCIEGEVTTACVRRQLREMQSSYLCALSKQSRGGTLTAEPAALASAAAKQFAVPSSVSEKGKYFSIPSPHGRSVGGYSRGSTAVSTRRDLFMLSVEEEAKMDEDEQLCRVEATRFSRYVSRLPFLDSRWEDLPISSDDGALSPDEAAFLRELSEDEQRSLRQALHRERELAGEMLFLKTFTSAPLLKRLNCQSDSTVIREMEAWYIKARAWVQQRYSRVLEERSSVLQSAVTMFAAHTGALADRTGRVDLGHPFNLPKHRAKDKRYRNLMNRHVKSGAQNGTIQPLPSESVRRGPQDEVSETSPTHNSVATREDPAGRKGQPQPRRARPKKLAPIDVCLHKSKVKNQPFSNYLQHYFNGLELVSPPSPPETPMKREESINHVEEPVGEGGEQGQQQAGGADDEEATALGTPEGDNAVGPKQSGSATSDHSPVSSASGRDGRPSSTPASESPPRSRSTARSASRSRTPSASSAASVSSHRSSTASEASNA